MARSSLDDAIREAKRVGASVEEARLVHDLVKANTSPEIRSFEVKFGPDSTNNIAVWIDLFVDKNFSPSRENLGYLNRIADKIRTDLQKNNFRYWPYVEVRSNL
jgi:hypothetical protein